jgi:hypothetical protein
LRFLQSLNDRIDFGAEQSRLAFQVCARRAAVPNWRSGWHSGRVRNARPDKFWLNPLRDPMFQACRRLVWQDNAKGNVLDKQHRWRISQERDDFRCVSSLLSPGNQEAE